MPVGLFSRCKLCHQVKPHSDFPVLGRTRDSKTKKVRTTRDGYCNDCRPKVTPAMRMADLRDNPKRDAPDR